MVIRISKPRHSAIKELKKGEPLSELSLSVPGAGQFSNSLYTNLDEFKALKESLKPN